MLLSHFTPLSFILWRIKDLFSNKMSSHQTLSRSMPHSFLLPPWLNAPSSLWSFGHSMSLLVSLLSYCQGQTPDFLKLLRRQEEREGHSEGETRPRILSETIRFPGHQGDPSVSDPGVAVAQSRSQGSRPLLSSEIQLQPSDRQVQVSVALLVTLVSAHTWTLRQKPLKDRELI